MRVDKTLSELYDLLDSTYNERLLITARMAVNTIKKLQEENEKIGMKYDQSLDVIVGLSNDIQELKEIIHKLKIS